jgi:hypothetical protein
MLRRVVIVMAVMAFGACAAPRALANQNPPNCGANGLDLTIVTDKTLVRNGDVVNYQVWIANDRPGSCDISGASVTFALPGPDGQPVAAPQTIVTNQNYPAGTAPILLATIPYTVAVNPGVTELTPDGHAHGDLHISLNNGLADIDKTLKSTVAQPSMALTKTASTKGGVAPQTVTYTYTLVNTSSTHEAIANPTVSDNLCSPLGLVGGDANGNQQLDYGETWVYTCTTTYNAANCYTNVATANGTSTTDNKPVPPVQATATVCVTAPPPPPPPAAPPGGAVKGASATSPHACVSLASTNLKVRAKELNTVRVRVRVNGKNIAKSKVRITGPAGLKKTGMTNSKGMVTFVLRPKKSGRLTIASDQCSVKAKVSVKPARRVVAPALPEVTG